MVRKGHLVSCITALSFSLASGFTTSCSPTTLNKGLAASAGGGITQSAERLKQARAVQSSARGEMMGMEAEEKTIFFIRKSTIGRVTGCFSLHVQSLLHTLISTLPSHEPQKHACARLVKGNFAVRS
jgi:hypothetical protein